MNPLNAVSPASPVSIRARACRAEHGADVMRAVWKRSCGSGLRLLQCTLFFASASTLRLLRDSLGGGVRRRFMRPVPATAARVRRNGRCNGLRTSRGSAGPRLEIRQPAGARTAFWAHAAGCGTCNGCRTAHAIDGGTIGFNAAGRTRLQPVAGNRKTAGARAWRNT